MDNDKSEFDLSGPVGLRDMPLCFRWKAERSAIAGLCLPPARDGNHEDARTAVLTQALLADEVKRWVSFSRRKAYYAARRRYFGTSFTYRNVLDAVADGVNAGLLEEDRALPGSRGRQSRFRATPILASHLKDCPVRFEPHEVICLRNHDGQPVAYTDTERTRRMREEVERINSNMRQIALGLVAPGVRKVGRHWVISGDQIPSYTPMRSRVFNRGSFEKGGRLYGWFQGLPSKYRAAMTIDGEPVLEPDYAQLHAQIIYAMRDIPLDGDAYETGEFPRNDGKLAFNIAVNAEKLTAAQWLQSPKI